jgi:anaerobic ribonucleoside-triphosphate reductase
MKKIPCQVYARVVGYYRPVSAFNTGKKEEWNSRVLIKVNAARQVELEKNT